MHCITLLEPDIEPRGTRLRPRREWRRHRKCKANLTQLSPRVAPAVGHAVGGKERGRTERDVRLSRGSTIQTSFHSWSFCKLIYDPATLTFVLGARPLARPSARAALSADRHPRRNRPPQPARTTHLSPAFSSRLRRRLPRGGCLPRRKASSKAGKTFPEAGQAAGPAKVSLARARVHASAFGEGQPQC